MNIEKLCVCYASEFHLGLILLEYLEKQNLKESKVVTYFEKGIKKEIDLIKNKYKYNKIDNKINFDKTINIEKINETNEKDVICIIRGTVGYIKEIQQKLKNEIKFTNIKIISCYSFEEQKNYMNNIMKENDKVLYTKGEEKII